MRPPPPVPAGTNPSRGEALEPSRTGQHRFGPADAKVRKHCSDGLGTLLGGGVPRPPGERLDNRPRTHLPPGSGIGGVQRSATLQAVRLGGIVNRCATRGTPWGRPFGPPHRPGVGQSTSRRGNAYHGHETPDRAPGVGHLRIEHADGYERQRQGHQHRDEESRALHAPMIAFTAGGFERRRRRGEV